MQPCAPSSATHKSNQFHPALWKTSANDALKKESFAFLSVPFSLSFWDFQKKMILSFAPDFLQWNSNFSLLPSFLELNPKA